MRELTILILVANISFFSFCQTTIVSQGFEASGSDTWNYTSNPPAYIEGGGNINVWSPVRFVGTLSDSESGDKFWGIRGLNNSGSGGDFEHILHFDNVTTSGLTNVLVSFFYNTIDFDPQRGDYIKVEFFFDNVSQGQEELSINTNGWEPYSRAVPNGTSKVRFSVIVKQKGIADYGGIDSIVLQSDANTSPALTIDFPGNGASIPINSAGFDVIFSTNNFVMSEDNGSGASDNTGDGYIKYTVDGGPEIDKFGDHPIHIAGLSEGNHTITLNLVNNNGFKVNPEVKTTVNFTIFNVVQSLPFSDSFEYPVGETLDAQDNWINAGNSDDNVIINSENLSYPGLGTSTGNSISFDGSGADPYIEFENITTGRVYFSFIFKVTNIVTLNDQNGGYFALLRNGNSFESRVWLKKATDASFYIGMSTGATGNFTSDSFELNTPIFLAMSYDLSTGTSSLWVNPDPALPAPTSTLSETTSPAQSLDNFLIRQGFSNDTPFIVMDELKIGTSWGEVTNLPLNVGENELRNPTPVVSQNPIQNGMLQFSQVDKDVQISIFNVLGHTSIATFPMTKKIDISHLSSGVYLAQFYKNSKIVGSEKIIVQ